jgi:tetratricopeptide (TPR) repeat protein
MANRIKKYNPAFLTPEELVQSFVVRYAELDTIVQVIRENVTQSNQHILVIGPRGIGKTMLALRVVEEIREEDDLRQTWYPLVFGEESYQVSTPGEFWLEALFHLAHKTQDDRWGRTHEELMQERDEERLRERALAQLMDFADAEGKRILLVVENFNMLLGEQIDDSDAWKLRHTLLHEPRVMLLATATSRFKAIDNSDKAMFDLFKLHELGPLDEIECGTLWSSISGKEASDERVRPLQILTGGNPRLLAIISTFAARMSLKELMDDLMQLVDDHTEYFKTHLDNLPPIERKAYLALAELWDPAPARKVADFARLNVNKASSLLRRLVERGMVMEADGQGRAKLYQVSERMYNIYYLMRRRGAPSQRVRGLVRFMVPFYGPREMVRLTRRIAEEACKLEPELRREHFWTYEAIVRSASIPSLRRRLIEAAPAEFFEMPDIPSSIRQFVEMEKREHAEALEAQVAELLKAGEELEGAGKFEEAEVMYRRVVEMAPKSARGWLQLGLLLDEELERYDEAEKAYRKAIEIDHKFVPAWMLFGLLLQEKLERYDDAEKAYRKAVEIGEKSAWPWAGLASLLYEKLSRYDEAENAYRKAIEIDQEFAPAWIGLAGLLHEKLERYDEAEKAYRKAIEIDESLAWAWAWLGQLLDEKLERYDEAEKAYRKAIEIDEKSAWTWAHLAYLLHENLERYDEAEKAYRKVIEIDQQFAAAWALLGQLLHEKLERYDEAEEAYRKAIEIEQKYEWAWAKLGELLHEKLERYDEAERAYRKAIEIDDKYASAWAKLGQLLHEKLGRYDEAEKAYRKAVEIEEKYASVWVLLGRLLYDELERYEEAEKAYRKAIEADANDEAARRELFELVLRKPACREEALSLAEEYLGEHAQDAVMLNSFAWTIYKHGGRDLLSKAETWARRAIKIRPDDGNTQGTLASILVARGKMNEALEHARTYLQDRETVEATIDDAIDLFVGIAAKGYAREALELLRESPSAEILEPLVVGLRLYVGEDVKAAAEIMEVGKDVVKRIKQRQQEMDSASSLP